MLSLGFVLVSRALTLFLGVVDAVTHCCWLIRGLDAEEVFFCSAVYIFSCYVTKGVIIFAPYAHQSFKTVLSFLDNYL